MKKIVIAIILLSLLGCATTRNVAIDREILPTLKGKSVTLVKHKSPSFVAMTSGKGMFAIAGVGAAAKAGNQMVKDNQINDPAINISEILANDLSSRYGISNKGQSSRVAESQDVPSVINLAGGSDFTLDVITKGWSFIYDGFKFSDYHVGYSANFRLIDAASSKIISEGYCAYDTKTAGKPPVKYETLLENNAAYIKQSLVEATMFCADKLKKDLF